MEIKNAIEASGGFIETQLNSHLLQVRPAYFIDLLLAISEEKERNECRKSIKKQIKQNDKINEKDIAHFEQKSIGQILAEKGPETVIDIIGVCFPVFSGQIQAIAKNIIQILRMAL